LTIEPAFASIMSGSTACAAKNWCFRLTAFRSFPIFRRHLERRMALIMRRIVDENLDPAKHAADLVDRRTQRGDVSEVGRLE